MRYLTLLLFCPALLFAQNHYKAAYMVTLKGDTINGFIDYREWGSNPRFVKFKTDKNAPIQKLTPDNTSFFNIYNFASFQRYEGRISHDPINENKMISERDTNFTIDKVFLKILTSGNYLKLYSYTDDIKSRLFYKETKDDSPIELVYRLYYDLEKVNVYTDTGRTVNENTYMKQLYAIAQKYGVITSKLQRDIEDSRYDKSYIIRIVNTINGIKK